MYSPGDGFARESPKGGMLLRGFYVPEGTIIMVSWNFVLMCVCLLVYNHFIAV